MLKKSLFIRILAIASLLLVNLQWGLVSASPVDSEIQSTILFVKPGTNGDCLSWSTACELQTALFNAIDGDQIWVAAGTYKPTTSSNREATFQLKNGVAIYGGFPSDGGAWEERDWEGNPTKLSGDIGVPEVNTDNSYHVLTGSWVDATAMLDGLTISGGNANGTSPNYGGGGMYNSSSSPSLTNVTFSDNNAYDGGGMYNSASNPTLTNVTFSDNNAYDGGGMYNSASNPTLTNVTFSGNMSSEYGGGMVNNGSSPSLSNVTFSENIATEYGGGLCNEYSSNPTLSNVTFSGNMSTEYGGGMYNSGSNPSLSNVTFIGNTISGDYSRGGGMFNSSSSPTLSNVTFSGNSTTGVCGYGGGMYNRFSSSPSLTDVTFSGNTSLDSGGGMCNEYSSSPTLTNVIFSNNTAMKHGGGICNTNSSSPTLTKVTFSSNTATFGGGGIYNNQSNPSLTDVTFDSNTGTSWGSGMYNYSSSPSLSNVTFSGNTATGCGGGMYNDGSSPTLTNVTFIGNTTTTYGGGMSNWNNSTPSLTNVTFSANTANTGGGISNNNSSSPTVINSILWGNVPDQISGSATVNYSDVQGGYAGIGNTNVDPLLGSLADNGGLTHTLALGEGSPAIDAADTNSCPTLDQRYYARPIDGDGDGTASCDMGAYEYDSYPATFLLTLEVLGSGLVIANPDKADYYYGEVVTLSATANSDWFFAGWGGDVSSIENPLTITIYDDTSIIANFVFNALVLTVSVIPEGAGTVSLNPDTPTYPYMSEVSATATPNPGWSFAGWTGDASGTTNPTSVTMSSHKSITANFTQDEYYLNVTVNPEGVGSVTIIPSKPNYHYGEIVTLTASPSIGWKFTGWDGDASGATNPLEVTITDDTNIIANFSDQFTLVTSVLPEGSGTITRDNYQDTYEYGTVVTLTAVPVAGWKFVSWGGDASGSENPLPFTILSDTAITANFTKEEYTLTVAVNPEGKGSVLISPLKDTYQYDDEVTLTATAIPGWKFDGWSGDVTSTDNPLVLTFTGNTSVIANFTNTFYIYLPLILKN